ncbi:4'-phosphopantetheinyl transferase superfamily protein [Paenibacillus sp. P25]|nr:4'-phosphopantetheinyl transferase superfamily protein [Paenibacillus sp. P25]
MELYAVHLKELPTEEVVSALMPLVPKEKTEKLRRFKFKEDCCRSLAAELLIRVILAGKTRLKNREIRFGRNAYGKPHLTDYPLHFNLSHAGHWVVCAIDEAPIGIDIEEIKPIDLTIAKRFFSHVEWMDLEQKPEEDKLGRFYDLWTLKESYMKNIGLGLSIPLNQISFTVNGEISDSRMNIPVKSGILNNIL